MRRFVPLLSLVMWGLGHTTVNSNEPPKRQMQIALVIARGDPLGSQADGTLRVFSLPTSPLLEGRPFSIMSGGEEPFLTGDEARLLPFGIKVDGKIEFLANGKLLLDLAVTESTIEKSHDDSRRLASHGTRVLTKINVGEKLWFRWGIATPPNENWVRVIVEELNP